MSGSSITEFINARLDEFQADAEAAEDGFQGDTWTVDAEGNIIDALNGVRDHVHRHSPAYVLADIAAKRALVEFLRPAEDMPEGEGKYVAERVLFLLAAPFASHEAYDERWSVSEHQPCGDELWEGE